MSLSFYCSVYCTLDLCKNRVRRQHLAVFVRAIYAGELRITLTLLPVDFADLYLELYVSLMDVVGAFEILSVGSSALALEF